MNRIARLAAPVASRVAARVAGALDIVTASRETVELCPTEVERVAQPLFLAHQLDRVRAAQEHAPSLQAEIERAVSETTQHVPTLAFRLRDVVLANGLLCNLRALRRMSYRPAPWKPARIEREVRSAVLCSTATGNDFFGHFLLDDACTARLAHELGAPPCFASTGAPRSPHVLAYLERWGIVCDDIRCAWFEELWVCQDIGMNRHKRARLQAMRRCIAEGDARDTGKHIAYVRRGRLGAPRRLVNEHEIEAMLQARGCVILDPDVDSLESMHAMLRSIRIVVGIEGSQLTHALFALPDGATMLCLQPPDRFTTIYRYYTNALGLNWAFVVGAGTIESFSVPVQDVERTLDLIENSGR